MDPEGNGGRRLRACPPWLTVTATTYFGAVAGAQDTNHAVSPRPKTSAVPVFPATGQSSASRRKLLLPSLPSRPERSPLRDVLGHGGIETTGAGRAGAIASSTLVTGSTRPNPTRG